MKRIRVTAGQGPLGSASTTRPQPPETCRWGGDRGPNLLLTAMNQLARTKQTKAAMPLVKYGPLPGSLGRPRRYSWWDEAPRLLHLALLNQVPKPHHPLHHHHHHHPPFSPCKYLLGKTLVIPPSVATNLAKTPALTGREDEAVDQSDCNRSSRGENGGMCCDDGSNPPTICVQWFCFRFLVSLLSPLQAGVVRQEGQKLKKKQLDGKQQSRNDSTKRDAALTARRPSSSTRPVPW